MTGGRDGGVTVAVSCVNCNNVTRGAIYTLIPEITKSSPRTIDMDLASMYKDQKFKMKLIRAKVAA